jgi:hypothetical protein
MTCSLCHSREVLGVRLPMLQAAILDRVRRAGDEGVTSVEILTDCFQDRRPVKIQRRQSPRVSNQRHASRDRLADSL